MRRFTGLSTLVFTLSLLPQLAFSSLPSPTITSLDHADQEGCLVTVTLPDAGLFEIDTPQGLRHQIEQDGMQDISPGGEPALQGLTWSLQIPATAAVGFDLDYQSMLLLQDVDLLPQEQDNPDLPLELSATWQENRFYPEQIVSISEPAVMRGHRLVQVAVTPYQYNPVTRELRVYQDLQLDIDFHGSNPVNQPKRELPRSATFEQLLQHNVLNYDAMNQEARDGDGQFDLEPILYIYNSAALNYDLQDLIDWKRRKGHLVYTATQLDMTLTSSTSVGNYIQNAYDNWDNPPVFVVLVGDPSSCTFGTVAASDYDGDHQYSRVDGGDILGDVFVGRMSVNSTSQLEAVVFKQIRYERNPYNGDPAWFDSALLVGDDSISGMSVTYINENIRHMMEQSGMSNVSTCYNYQGCTNEPYYIDQYFNNGILYFNYRGYLGMSGYGTGDIDDLQNGYRTPFVVSVTCASNDFTSGTGIAERFYQVGSSTLPKGGVAAIGTATIQTHTRYNNVVDGGIYGGIFNHGLTTAGAALFQGKYELWQAFEAFASGYVENFSSWNNLMGDASLQLWTGPPQAIVVTHDNSIPSGVTALPVSVTSGGLPLADARVCLYQTGGMQVTGLTAADGTVTLPLDQQLTAGSAVLTVTGENIYPYQSSVNLTTETAYLDMAGVSFSDDNGDGIANPGETLTMSVTLENLGVSQSASSINATMSSIDDRVTVVNDYSTYPNAAPGAQVTSYSSYEIQIDPTVIPGSSFAIDLLLDISSSAGSFDGVIHLELEQPRLQLELVSPDPDGDDVIGQGENGELDITLFNGGNIPTGTCNATLTSSDPFVTVVDGSASYSSIAVDGTGTNSTSFMVRPAGDSFNGQQLPFTLTLTNGDGIQLQQEFELQVGLIGVADPMGPVGGYYCFDSGDEFYSNRPVYNWTEISGSGTLVPLTDYYDEDDDSYTINLPFNFVYWGESYTRVTVCSNGWLAMGDQDDQVSYRNYSIPTSPGPGAMIAPFWDDMRVASSGNSGRVYYYHDSANHRFIVEWYQVTQVGPGSPSETFQAILYDQDYYGTTNGDILFQYQDVTNNTNNSGTDVPYATVGIESPQETDGILYTYWNSYPDGALQLSDGLAILFTEERGIFSFTDSAPPQIVHNHEPLLNGTGPFTLEADISDPSGVADATLYWSLNGVDYNASPMTLVSGDTWAGSVPSQSLGTTIYYYFWAQDASENNNEATSGTYSFINGNLDVYFTLDAESGSDGWTHSAPTGWNEQWHLSTEDNQSPTHSWKCGDTGAGEYTALLDARLVSPEITILPFTQLQFYHRLQGEVSGTFPDSAYDGGILEITSNGGASWEQLQPAEGYNKAFRWESGGGAPATHPFPGGTLCWSGDFAWEEASVDLSPWTDETVQLRFRFGSDQSGGNEGWYLDDLTLTGVSFGEPEPVTIAISYNNPVVTVSWEAVPQAAAYRVYGSTNPHSGFELIQQTTSTNYIGQITDPYRFFQVTWID